MDPEGPYLPRITNKDLLLEKPQEHDRVIRLPLPHKFAKRKYGCVPRRLHTEHSNLGLLAVIILPVIGHGFTTAGCGGRDCSY
jgi:hypothetical protein